MIPTPIVFCSRAPLTCRIARRIKKRPNTTLLDQGRNLVAGKQSLWFKSTGPLPMSNGSPVMTRVQYIVPLGDGRVLEARLAAPPDHFDNIVTLMRQALQTLKITPRRSN